MEVEEPILPGEPSLGAYTSENEACPGPTISKEEQRMLKSKQERNILNKIEKIVARVTPIHEADYESDNENDMSDLIEYL